MSRAVSMRPLFVPAHCFVLIHTPCSPKPPVPEYELVEPDVRNDVNYVRIALIRVLQGPPPPRVENRPCVVCSWLLMSFMCAQLVLQRLTRQAQAGHPVAAVQGRRFCGMWSWLVENTRDVPWSDIAESEPSWAVHVDRAHKG